MIQSNIVIRQKRGIILFHSEGEFTSLVMSEKTKTPQERGFCLRERLFWGRGLLLLLSQESGDLQIVVLKDHRIWRRSIYCKPIVFRHL